MKDTECKDCKLRNGDCGYHYKGFGKTNYDIPSLTACDRYGNCEFFQPKEKPQGDLISREALKEKLSGKEYITYTHEYGDAIPVEWVMGAIDNAPTVEPEKPPCNQIAWEQGYEAGVTQGKSERPQGEYVDISKLRLMTVEECAGHTIEYAMGWKACIEWIKKGG